MNIRYIALGNEVEEERGTGVATKPTTPHRFLTAMATSRFLLGSPSTSPARLKGGRDEFQIETSGGIY